MSTAYDEDLVKPTRAETTSNGNSDAGDNAAAERVSQLAQAYRRSSVTVSFAYAVAETIRDQVDLHEHAAEIMSLLDEAMAEMIVELRFLGGRSAIQCELDAYNNVEEQWRLQVAKADLSIESSTTELDSSAGHDRMRIHAADADMLFIEKGIKRRRDKSLRQ